jgi:precorrin-2/cobalt-factor-2 C20-methyltransferase
MGRDQAMTATLHGIGLGPGDPELITLKALRILRAATVIAYPAPEAGDSLARRIAAPHLPGGQTEISIRMPMSLDRFPARQVYDQAARTIAAHLDSGRDVAALCQGDPFLYGSFIYLYERLAATYRCVIVPGVSSLMASAAALGSPLAARDDCLVVLPAPLDDASLAARLALADGAAIIKLGRHLARVRALLERLDLARHARYVERATMAEQRVIALGDVDAAEAPYFATILVHRRGEAWR